MAEDGLSVTDSNGTVLMELGKHNSLIIFSGGAFTVRPGWENHPAAYLSWFGCVTLCNIFGEMRGYPKCYNLDTWSCDFSVAGIRLPTEAEWECAARGGRDGGRFPWPDADTINHERANYKAGPRPGATEPPPYDANPTPGLHPTYAEGDPPSSPVGAFAANPYGLHDMAGNVWEWVWDWSLRYPSAPQIDPTGPETGIYRVFRGGSWFTTAGSCIVAARYRSSGPGDTVEDVGFRYVIPCREEPPAEGNGN